MTTPPVLILDNGAYTIKAGYSGIDWEPRVFPNSIARSRAERKVFVADEIEGCRDLSGIAYRRPFEKGMLVNWDAEKIIWDRLFSKEVLDVNAPETSLLVTEPYFNLPNIAETYDQMVFEEWEFQSYYRCSPASLAPYGGLFSNDHDIPPACSMILDIGYSFSHVLPVKNGQIIWEHVRRIDIGGKLLTNHLKHLISFRQWNMADETHVVNAVKEACCYVSMDWKRDTEICKENPKKNSIVQEYVLPDFSAKSTSTTGYIRSGPNAAPPPEVTAKQTKASNIDEEEQVLWMGNERFQGSELLFNPSDTGLNQSGLADTIAEIIAEMPEELRGMYWANIGILGGLGYIEALGERLEQDLRALCPSDYEIGIFEAFDPPSVPYTSACSLTTSEYYLETYPVTRAEYLEHGSSICRRRFGGPSYNVTPPGFLEGDAGGDVSDDERERRYALGLESIRGKGKGKRKVEEQEVTSGNWGGRRRRAAGML